MKFSALILAGGQSRRMGQDKAMLEVNGRPLLARQIELVRELGPKEILLSGRAGTDYPAAEAKVLLDLYPEAGPLAGVERGLAAATAPLLLVLAVDLPHMTSDYLRRLLAMCQEDCGVIPEIRGMLEPLAAVYPRRAHAIAVEHLQAGQNGMQHFAKQIEQAGGLRRVPVATGDEPLFFNWNTPGALTG